MKKTDQFLSRTTHFIILSSFVLFLGSCNLIKNATVNADAALHGGGATRIKQAEKDSWNNYFVDYGSSNRVLNVTPELVLGPHVGVNAEVPLSASTSGSRGWHISPGLYYNLKGWKVKGEYSSGTNKIPFSNKESYHYINLDLPFRYRIINRFYIEAGPEFGLMVARKSVETDDVFRSENKSLSGIKNFELGICGGAGYSIGNTGFGVYIKMAYGLTKIDDSEPYYSKSRNIGAMIGINYAFVRPCKKTKNTK